MQKRMSFNFNLGKNGFRAFLVFFQSSTLSHDVPSLTKRLSTTVDSNATGASVGLLEFRENTHTLLLWAEY